MIAMHLIPPTGGRKKWRIRFVNHDGAIRVVMGYADEAATIRLKHRIVSLVSCRLNADPPPAELSKWIETMDPKMAVRLIKLGLLDRRRREQVKPITGHIDDFKRHVATRRGNSVRHGNETAAKVTRICTELKVETYNELSANETTTRIGELGFSPATQRSYLVAIRDFCAWMVADKRAATNPMEAVMLPKPVPQTDRKPFTVDEVRKLLAHMTTFDRHYRQLIPWPAAERRVLYWLAVKTGLRINTLRKMTVAWLRLEGKPAAVVVPARAQKNKTPLEVPIPADLAEALATHVANKLPGASVFQIPEGKAVVSMLRRDLKGAGIAWEWEGSDDVRDFHTLRHTAITWWLEEDGLSQLAVQRLAGLKTLAMVQRYSRNFKADDTAWLNRGPVLDQEPKQLNVKVG